MSDKILGLCAFALSAASHVFIRHTDTAMTYSLLFAAIGIYEFALGELRQRRRMSEPASTEFRRGFERPTQ